MEACMRKTKLLVLPMLLMLGLLTSGLAHAYWSQTLYIEGNVASGKLDWEFTFAMAEDEEGKDWNCGDNFVPTPWEVDKDVGSTTIEITDPHTVTLTLTNVYPSYWTSADVYAHNNGTIPLIIDRVIINGNVFRKINPFAYAQLDLDKDGKYDIETRWWNGFGEKIDPCGDSPGMSFWIHVLQDAPQGKTLEFTIEIVAIQWNEYEPPQ